MKKCIKCNTRSISSDEFCWNCGERKIDVKDTCPNGHKIDSLANFCTTCGSPIVDIPLVQENALDSIAKAQAEEIPDKYQNPSVEDDLFAHEPSLDNIDDEPENL